MPENSTLSLGIEFLMTASQRNPTNSYAREDPLSKDSDLPAKYTKCKNF